MKKRNKTYAIYNKEDELLFIGDVHGCCGYLNISSNAFFKRLNRKNKHIYIIEEDIVENVLPNFVYTNLKQLGLCAISTKKIDRYGKEKIIKELENNGFKNININLCKSKDNVIIKAQYKGETKQ